MINPLYKGHKSELAKDQARVQGSLHSHPKAQRTNSNRNLHFKL